MCFLVSADQKRCNLIFKQLGYRDNVGRDEYRLTIISSLDILIRTEGCICGNQQSTHKNFGGRGGRHPKEYMGLTFSQQRQVGTEENSVLVPGRDGTILNINCYNCHNMGHIYYNCYEAGHTGT